MILTSIDSLDSIVGPGDCLRKSILPYNLTVGSPLGVFQLISSKGITDGYNSTDDSQSKKMLIAPVGFRGFRCDTRFNCL